uniref:Vomeronasal type-1 receptor n=1 Tax=Laticauda laticaudata TaxID=8630 RepID=A0A8C5RWH2_LATLA
MASSFMFFVSILIYLSSFVGMIGNLIVLFAFLTHAVRRKALQPLDRIIVNMGLVNFFLCCYKAIPGMLVFSSTKVFGEQGCRVLLYTYHTLRLISIWSVENLSILHLIKIRRPNYRWTTFIHRHQSRYVNVTLIGCWVASVLLQIPYLQYEKTGGQRNKTIAFLATSTCLRATESFAMKFTTYVSISLDLMTETFSSKWTTQPCSSSSGGMLPLWTGSCESVVLSISWLRLLTHTLSCPIFPSYSTQLIHAAQWILRSSAVLLTGAAL